MPRLRVRTGLTSGKAYMFLQETGDSELMKSRASVIFSLNDMVDDGILEYEEESGKGGARARSIMFYKIKDDL